MSRPEQSPDKENKWQSASPWLLFPWATTKFVAEFIGFVFLAAYATYNWNTTFYYIPSFSIVMFLLLVPMQQSQVPILRIIERIINAFAIFVDDIVLFAFDNLVYLVSPLCFFWNFLVDVVALILNVTIVPLLVIIFKGIFTGINPFGFTLTVPLVATAFPIASVITTEGASNWIEGAYGKSLGKHGIYMKDSDILKSQHWVVDEKDPTIVYAHPLLSGVRSLDIKDPLLKPLIRWLAKIDKRDGTELPDDIRSGKQRANFHVDASDFDVWTNPNIPVSWRRSLTARFLRRAMDQANGLIETKINIWDGYSYEAGNPRIGVQKRDSQGQPISPWAEAIGGLANWRNIGIIEVTDAEGNREPNPKYRLVFTGRGASSSNPLVIFDAIASFFFDLLDGIVSLMLSLVDILLAFILSLFNILSQVLADPLSLFATLLNFFFRDLLGIKCIDFSGFGKFAISVIDCICGPIQDVVNIIFGQVLSRWFDYEKATSLSELPKALLSCIGLACIDIDALTSNPFTFAATFLVGCLGVPKRVACCVISPWGCLINLMKELLNCPCNNNWSTIDTPKCKWLGVNNATEPFKCVMIWLIDTVMAAFGGGSACDINSCISEGAIANAFFNCLWNSILSSADFIANLIGKVIKKIIKKIKKKFFRREVNFRSDMDNHSQMSLLNMNVKDAALDDVLMNQNEHLQRLDAQHQASLKAMAVLLKNLNLQNLIQNDTERIMEDRLTTTPASIQYWRQVRSKTYQIQSDRIEYQKGQTQKLEKDIVMDGMLPTGSSSGTSKTKRAGFYNPDVEDDNPQFLLDLECFRVYYLISGKGWDPSYPVYGTPSDDVNYESALILDHVMVESIMPLWNPLHRIVQYLDQEGKRSEMDPDHVRQAEHVIERAKNLTRERGLAKARQNDRQLLVSPLNIRLDTVSSGGGEWGTVKVQHIRPDLKDITKDAVATLNARYKARRQRFLDITNSMTRDDISIYEQYEAERGNPDSLMYDTGARNNLYDYITGGNHESTTEEDEDSAYDTYASGVRGEQWMSRQIHRVFGKDLSQEGFRRTMQTAMNERVYQNPFLRAAANRFMDMKSTVGDWLEYQFVGPDPFIVDGVRTVVGTGVAQYAGDGPYTMYPAPPSWIRESDGRQERRIRFYRTEKNRLGGVPNENHAYAIHLESLQTNPYYAGMYKVALQLSYGDALPEYNSTENPYSDHGQEHPTVPDEIWDAMSANDGKPLFYLGRWVAATNQMAYGIVQVVKDIRWDSSAYALRFPSTIQSRTIISEAHFSTYFDDLVAAISAIFTTSAQSSRDQLDKQAREVQETQWTDVNTYLDDFYDIPKKPTAFQNFTKLDVEARNSRHSVIIQFDVMLRTLVARLLVPHRIDAILDVLSQRGPIYRHYAEATRDQVNFQRHYVATQQHLKDYPVQQKSSTPDVSSSRSWNKYDGMVPDWEVTDEHGTLWDALGWSLLGWKGGLHPAIETQTEPVYVNDTLRYHISHEFDSNYHKHTNFKNGDIIHFTGGARGVFVGRAGDVDKTGMHPTAFKAAARGLSLAYSGDLSSRVGIYVTSRSTPSGRAASNSIGGGGLGIREPIIITIASLSIKIFTTIAKHWRLFVATAVFIISSPWGIFVIENEVLFFWKKVIKPMYTMGLLSVFGTSQKFGFLVRDWFAQLGALAMFFITEFLRIITCWAPAIMILAVGAVVGFFYLFAAGIGIVIWIVTVPVVIFLAVVPLCPPPTVVKDGNLQQTVFMWIIDLVKCFDITIQIGKNGYDGKCVTPSDCKGRAVCRCRDKGGQISSLFLEFRDNRPCGTDLDPTGGCMCWPKLPCEWRSPRVGDGDLLDVRCDQRFGYEITTIAWFDNPNVWQVATSSVDNFVIWNKWIVRQSLRGFKLPPLLFTVAMTVFSLIFLYGSKKWGLIFGLAVTGFQYISPAISKININHIIPGAEVTKEKGWYIFRYVAKRLLEYLRYPNFTPAEPLGHTTTREGICWFFNSATAFSGLTFTFFWVLFWFFLIWYSFGLVFPYILGFLAMVFRPFEMVYKKGRKKVVENERMKKTGKYLKDLKGKAKSKIPKKFRRGFKRNKKRIGNAYRVIAPVVWNEVLGLFGQADNTNSYDPYEPQLLSSAQIRTIYSSGGSDSEFYDSHRKAD